MNRTKAILVCLAGAAFACSAAGCSQPGPASTTTGAGGAGGTTGSGGNSTGNGGNGTGNGTGGNGTGTGGSNTGAGGSAGTGAGGSSSPDAATTGNGGAGGTSDAGSALTPAAIVPKLDGYLWIGTCAAGAPSTGNATDCPIYPPGVATCPNVNATDFNMRGARLVDNIPILGDSTKMYTINMEVRGVAGLRCYNGGSRVPPLSSDVEGPTGNDGWEVGGTPVDSKWNTWEFHVLNASGSEVGVYYLNAVQPSSIYCERHETFVMKYTASFQVPGGGSIQTVIHDSNCAGQQNCGAPDSQTTCGNPRSVSLVGMDPQPPSSFMQPPITNTYHPQWLFFDVKSVTSP